MLGKSYSVWCDGRPDGTRNPNCRTWIAQEETSQAARGAARRAGWLRVPKNAEGGPRDVCRACRTDR